MPVQEKSELMEVYADALWDYSGGNELELCFNAGDVLEILDRGNESWWWASNMGTCGYIPSNHVRVSSHYCFVTIDPWLSCVPFPLWMRCLVISC